MELTFAADDLALLRRITERYLVDLRGEIVRTDNFTARRELQAEEVAVKRLIGELGGHVFGTLPLGPAGARGS